MLCIPLKEREKTEKTGRLSATISYLNIPQFTFPEASHSPQRVMEVARTLSSVL